MNSLLNYFNAKSSFVLTLQGLLAVLALGAVDYLMGWETSLSILYAMVAGMVAYHGGMVAGSIIAVAGVAAWNATDVMTGIPYSHWYALYWNIVVRIGMFVLFAYMMSYLRKEVELVAKLARTDSLTGVFNSRHFYEVANIELSRASRYGRPFTVVYIDLDGFKAVNDTLGHQVGDEVLRSVAQTIRQNLRATDCVARLGGDEYAVLLSESTHAASSGYLVKMQRQLLDEMQRHGWAVTFSIGAMTFDKVPASLDAMIGAADKLMYEVKQNGKNSIRHERTG